MNIGSTSGTPGLNVNELFNSGHDSISKKGQALQTKMNEMLSQAQVSPEDMMALQFEVGKYNAMMESLSSVTKSMTDMMKSLAQRTGARLSLDVNRVTRRDPRGNAVCFGTLSRWQDGRISTDDAMWFCIGLVPWRQVWYNIRRQTKSARKPRIAPCGR